MRLRVCLLTAGIAALAAAAPARAAVYTVTGTSDSTSGTCTGTSCTTLRAALAAAAAVTGPDTITLPAVSGTPYSVTAGQLLVNSEVAITGASAATVSVQGDAKSSRIFDVTTTAKVTISHLTITSGAALSSTDGVGGNILVGQGANLTLDHVRVANGRALRGGGIGMQPASTLTITRSLIDHNTATFATGVVSGDAGALLSTGNAKLAGNVLHISDSTIAQNSASQGAGIVLQNNAANQTTLDRVTVAFNSAGSNSLGSGVSVNDAESVKVGSSIIAGNTGDGVPTNCDTKLTSTGGNIDTGTSCGFAAPADRPGTDPQLSTVLGMAGGETPVLSIPATSPAVDFAPLCSANDQRDLSRPQGKTCDSGAYEVDQAPDTSITSGPSGLVNSTTATFTFASTDPGSTFRCSLDNAAASACSPPQTYTNLAQGAHTLTVAAVDPAGNVDPTPAKATWTVDSVAPDTTLTPITSPTKDNTPTFSFTSSESGSTFQCRVDGAAFAACTSPFTTSALADGSHSFDVRAVDAAGNVDSTPASQTFVVDTTPPDTTLVAIASPTNDSTPTFTFTSSESGSTFQCRVDTAAFAACTSPTTTASLSDGSHTFQVRATDAAGNTDATPASQTFVVDTVAPNTTLTPVASPTNDNTPTFSFSSSESGSTFQCRLDGAAFATCGSPLTTAALTDGSHTFDVRAIDAAGNADATPASQTFVVDTTAPDTTFTPIASPTNDNTPTFTFTSPDGSATFQCRVDGAAYAACASPFTTAALPDGSHTFDVRAVDPADNADATPASQRFVVDTTAPDTTLTHIASPTNDATPTFTFTSTETGSTFECKLDGAAFAACSSPLTTAALTEGSHTFQVRATDAAGNTDPTPASQTFVVDTTAPDTTLTPVASPTNDNTPTFTFTSPDGSATFQCRVDGAAYAACNSPFTTAALPDGSHTFDVRAVDPAGNADPTPASQTFVVNTTAPETTLTPIGSPTNDTTPTFTFSSSAAGSTFACRVDGAAFSTCTSPFTTTALPDGSHTFEVRATDPAGNADPTPASQTFVVDTTPPPADVTGGPAGVTTDSAPAFSFGSPDGTARFVCRIDGPGGPGTDAPCTSPTSFGTLAPGSYTFYVTAIDAAGNRTTTSRSFTVAAVQQVPPPQPVFHQTVVVQPAGGTVLVRRKGTKTFVPLDATQGIPLGSEVNAKHGKVRLTSVPKAGAAPQTALFYGGIFVVTQVGGITQVALSEPLAKCPPPARAATAAATKKKPRSRSLWGDGHGSFRTKGQYSAATVRGTKWNVKDSCAGTLTRVARGVVAVKDFVTRRTKVLRAGQRYLAKPKRRR